MKISRNSYFLYLPLLQPHIARAVETDSFNIGKAIDNIVEGPVGDALGAVEIIDDPTDVIE